MEVNGFLVPTSSEHIIIVGMCAFLLVYTVFLFVANYIICANCVVGIIRLCYLMLPRRCQLGANAVFCVRTFFVFILMYSIWDFVSFVQGLVERHLTPWRIFKGIVRENPGYFLSDAVCQIACAALACLCVLYFGVAFAIGGPRRMKYRGELTLTTDMPQLFILLGHSVFQIVCAVFLALCIINGKFFHFMTYAPCYSDGTFRDCGNFTLSPDL